MYPDSGTTANKIDDLIYNYENGNYSNRLSQITLPANELNNSSGYDALQNTISYDLNGNMSNQLDEKISDISYNFLNLPNQIVHSNGIINYVYRADGLKLKKVYAGKETDYLEGFQYETVNGNTTLQFFPTAEGYYDFKKNLYIYNYVDHLGNVRLSYTKNSAGVLEILEESNYYPFGLKHGGYNEIAGATPSYQYKYQGQELQETGWYSFKWRNYMPDVGRFFNVDSLSEKYSFQSHYNFSENRVVNARELEGLEAWVVNGREMTSAMPGWRTDARAVGFGLRHPIAASTIGSVASGSTNISSVAGRFARHFANATGTSKDIGSPSNALRHGLWSAMIRSEFDAGISKRATNAHEGVGIGESQYVDMSKPFTGKGTDGANLADHIVDVLNNNIGMGIAEANPNASTKDLVSAVLGEFKNNGLWTFSTDKDGNVSITRSKLTDSQYNTAVKTVNSLNSNGFSKDEQQKIDDQTRKSQEAMKSMGQSAGW